MDFKVGEWVFVKTPGSPFNGNILEIGKDSYLVSKPGADSSWFNKTLVRPLSESTIVTKLPEEGTLKKGLQTKGVNIQGEPITISWNFNPVFKEILLDIWYEKSKETWTTAYKECKEVGNDMIVWLSNSYPSEFEKIYQQALDEVGQEMIAQRTD